MAGSSNDRAQTIIEEALLRHLKIDRSKHKQLVRKVIKRVFADGHSTPAEEAKKKASSDNWTPKRLLLLRYLVHQPLAPGC